MSFFCLSFPWQDLQSGKSGLPIRVCESEQYPQYKKKRVRDHLAHLNMQKSIGPDGMHRYREEAGQCHCKATVYHLCLVMAIKAGSCWLGKKSQTSHSSTRRGRRIEVTTASQLSPQECYGANPPERYFKAHEGQESDWEQPRVNHA